ncbi:MAG: hypothetical protein ABI543_06365 [Ignavibacteria bacterium]
MFVIDTKARQFTNNKHEGGNRVRIFRYKYTGSTPDPIFAAIIPAGFYKRIYD